MLPPFSSYYDRIQACESAIVRIRAALRSGQGNTNAVADDLDFLLAAIRPRLTRAARELAEEFPMSMADILVDLESQVIDDVIGLSYASMDEQFGAYLRTLKGRIRRVLRRNYGPSSASSIVDSLDGPAGEDGGSRHEQIADEGASAGLDAVGGELDQVRAALPSLPPEQRHVILLRLADVPNTEIAKRFQCSPVKATRIFNQAVANLKRLINPAEE